MKKNLFKVIFIIVGIGALITICAVAKNYYDAWRQSKLPGFQIQKIYEEAAKNDIWGGKTPQETYEMFVAALKKGDIDLASKYFAGLEGKGRAKKWLAEKQQKGEMEKYVSELPKWEELMEREYWDPDGKEFVYKWIQKDEEIYVAADGATTTIPAGTIGESRIIFQISLPDKKIWKIYEL